MSVEPMNPEHYDAQDNLEKKFLKYHPLVLAFLPKRNLIRAIEVTKFSGEDYIMALDKA